MAVRETSPLQLKDLKLGDDFTLDQDGMLRGSSTVDFEDFIMTGAANLDRLLYSSIAYSTTVHCNPTHLSAEEYFSQKDKKDMFNRSYGLGEDGQPVKEWGEPFRRYNEEGWIQSGLVSMVVEEDHQPAGHILLGITLFEPNAGEHEYCLDVRVPLIYVVPKYRHKNLWMPLYTVASHLIYTATNQMIAVLPKKTYLDLSFHADYDSRAGEIIGNGLFSAMEVARDDCPKNKKHRVGTPGYDAGY